MLYKDELMLLPSLSFSLISDLCPDDREPATPAAESTDKNETDVEPTAK